ncbi:MAG: Endonuclease/exonuclease/phosphatase [Candidatus Kaiserbacteria bacterium]|nr:Endonuclease/exonuclease/phosphatase [Candidatus Kaiserbacteria bacterium]
MRQLKLVSVNIEYSKHLDRVAAFLSSQRPDVVCLQELREIDIPNIKAAFGAEHHAFAPVTRQTYEGEEHVVGIGILSCIPIVSSSIFHYTDVTELPASDTTDPSTYNKKLSPVLFCDFRREDAAFKIGTAHFTWTPDGSTSDEQRRDIKVLLSILEKLGEFVFTGDLNAPRIYNGKPGEIFSQLAERYKDNIPFQYISSLDPDLHRAGKLDLMVDGLFTTPGYVADGVELHTGVSDHCAITAVIRPVTP